MLKFYYNPLSPNARRVWITLLEKGIEFEPIILNLDGDQLQPEFLAINPFHHIPTLVDDGFKLVESLAIMDYLESKYPTPSLLPKNPQELAKVRMVQLVNYNELFPQMVTLICEDEDSPQIPIAKQKIDIVFKFFTEILGDSPYFGTDTLTLGDIDVGIGITTLEHLGITLNNYPKIQAWSERLKQRPIWQKTKISTEDFEKFKRRVRVLVKMRMREKGLVKKS
ncbi:MAG TPA: glutathione S-transferase family protein [Nostocaceae cyanobacterium]|nr:glutathione S-transferase family protein [Nostocaceae cyanobacterium]